MWVHYKYDSFLNIHILDDHMKKITPKEIVRKLEEHREGIRNLGVKRIGLFGSFLKGNQKEGSDIDFLVVFDNI